MRFAFGGTGGVGIGVGGDGFTAAKVVAVVVLFVGGRKVVVESAFTALEMLDTLLAVVVGKGS